MPDLPFTWKLSALTYDVKKAVMFFGLLGSSSFTRANPRRADLNEMEMNCIRLNQYITIPPQRLNSAFD